MTKFFYPAAAAAAAAGALAVAWVAAGYLSGNPLALAMTLLIGAFYAWGLWELWRFQRATQGLQHALAALSTPPATLADWLSRVPAGLRQAVRLRVEDERGALPGPALTPYLAGLLVLLGMLGTFLGMVVTLQGTGLALERATDVQSMRDSLAAPVRGLGLAFGTSVAGVAASAMLGLVSALCRRARTATALALEGHIAGALQPFTHAQQQREQRAQQQQLQQAAFQLQQQQAEQLPLLVGSLQALMAQMAEQAGQAQAQLLAGQQRFHGEAETAYQALASSVSQSLQHSLGEGARLAAAALQPAVQDTMSGITRETAVLHQHIASSVQQQLDGLARRFEVQSTAWVDALGAQTRQQTTALLQSLEAGQARQLAQQATQLQQTGEEIGSRAEAQARRTLDEVAHLVQVAGEAPRAAAEVVAQLRGQLSASLAQDQALLEERRLTVETLHSLLGGVQQHVDGLTQRFEQQTGHWLGAVGSQLQDQTRALLQALHEQQAQQQAQQAARDEQRLAAWTTTLAEMAAQLQHSTGQMTAQAEAQARCTLEEVARLVQTAGEAPRAAAEVVAQLRDKLSASLAQDNTLLEERSRIMDTLNTLLGAVQHTSTAQKAAIDELVASSARWLQEAGARFTEKAEAETARLEAVAAQLAASAVDVASLGDAFGGAVEQFGHSSQQMLAHLQHLDEALAKAGARSDEQLAYYVAQAREVIDLSLLSQKQIVDDLQRLRREATAGSEA